jgi:Ankyrin repeats (many copies)
VPDLPAEPSLQQLRHQARDLQRAVRRGDQEALAEVAARHPAGRPETSPETSGDTSAAARFPLSAAQLVVARRYDFPSWTRLRRYVEVVEQYSRFPERMAADSPADEFLRLGCLYYTDDQPERWAQARQVLAAHPEVTQASVYAAAATADVPRLRAHLAGDPGAARRPGGPFRCEPLFYLAYARHDPAIGEDAVLTSARLLLEAGADPNAGYLWHGLPTPFTVLTGVFGEGELGPVRQPRHPCSLALARLLLEAGADPNDGQALYNRMFEPGNDHLELLFEFGLGTGDGGPWQARMGDALDAPEQMVRGELSWAIAHGMTERVRLLAEHGVDLVSPFADGTTPAQCAATTGHPDLVRFLIERGAPEPDLDPEQRFAAAALAADQGALDELVAGRPGLAGAVRAARPALIVWAAAQGRPGSVELLARLGFDVNAKGRSDVPAEDPWQTALHVAAMDGRLELARSLLRLGADPELRDQRFDSTPLGWARYSGQDQLIELLEPLTAAEEAAPGDGSGRSLPRTRSAHLAGKHREPGGAVEDREQERPVHGHRDRRGRLDRGPRGDRYRGGRGGLGAVLVDVDAGLVRHRADPQRLGLGDAPEVGLVAERRGDTQPPQGRDEVERGLQPEPGQGQRHLVPGRPGQQAGQPGRGDPRAQRRQRPVRQHHGHGQADVTVGEQHGLVPVAAQVVPGSRPAHERDGYARAVRALRVERCVVRRVLGKGISPGRLQVHRAGEHQPGQLSDGAGRQQPGYLALGLPGDRPVDLLPRLLRCGEIRAGQGGPGQAAELGGELGTHREPRLDPRRVRRPEHRGPLAFPSRSRRVPGAGCLLQVQYPGQLRRGLAARSVPGHPQRAGHARGREDHVGGVSGQHPVQVRAERRGRMRPCQFVPHRPFVPARDETMAG